MAARPLLCCPSCSHRWYPRGSNSPSRCPHCGVALAGPEAEFLPAKASSFKTLIALGVGCLLVVGVVGAIKDGGRVAPNSSTPTKPVSGGDPHSDSNSGSAPIAAPAVYELAPIPRDVAQLRSIAAWETSLHEQADELADKIEKKEKLLAEREAIYKRRVDAGGLDGGTRDQIAQLKKEIEALHASQVKLEDELAKGPPEAVLRGDPIPKDVPQKGEAVAALPPKVNPAGVPSRLPAQVYTPPAVTLLPSGVKTVQVNGYTRKDGTYVQPHMRSLPRR